MINIVLLGLEVETVLRRVELISISVFAKIETCGAFCKSNRFDTASTNLLEFGESSIKIERIRGPTEGMYKIAWNQKMRTYTYVMHELAKQ